MFRASNGRRAGALVLTLGLLCAASPALADDAPSIPPGAPQVQAATLPANQVEVWRVGWVDDAAGDGAAFYNPVTHRPYAGWLVQGAARYYIDAMTGAPHEGWLDVDGHRYWMSDGADAPAGVMLADRWLEVDGWRYHLGATGAADTGWSQVDGTEYCFGADGRLRIGWVLAPDGSPRWMVPEDGTMARDGWHVVDGVWQAFEDDGTWAHVDAVPPGDDDNVANMSARQRAVVSACGQVPWPGPSLCAAWASAVLDRAGAPVPTGNACDMYREWCTSPDLSDLKPGMLVAVTSHPHTPAGQRYGHVGIYVGGGMVRDSGNEGLRVVELGTWIAWYGATNPVGWGWACGTDLSA